MSCTRKKQISTLKIEWLTNDGKNDIQIPIEVLSAVQDCQERIPIQTLDVSTFVLLPNRRFLKLMTNDMVKNRIKREYSIDDAYIAQNTYTFESMKILMETRNNGLEPRLSDELDKPLSWCLFVMNPNFVCWATGYPGSLRVDNNNEIDVDQYIAKVLVDINHRGRGLCPMMIDIIFNKFKDQGINTVGLINAAGKIGEKCYLHGSKYYNFECLKMDEDNIACGRMKFTRNKLQDK